MRTKEEVQRQIDGLLAERKTLPAESAFGDPNHEAIDAQVQVLMENETAETYADADEYQDYIYQQATEAEDWLNGDIDDDLFSLE